MDVDLEKETEFVAAHFDAMMEQQLPFARRIEAMMRQRSPEQAAVFLSLILSRLDETSRGYLQIAFTFAENLAVPPVARE